MKDKVVAIDGPAGSGKSSIAKRVAEALKFTYIDTGSMFRALGLKAVNTGLGIDDESDKLKALLQSIDLKYMKNDILIQIDGEDLSEKIRDHKVSDYASRISKLPMVRDYLLSFQRSMAQNLNCVMEGRDIGTVVFPNALCKIFLSAAPEVRAKRRLNQLKQLGKAHDDFETVLADILVRDHNDSNREVAPLKQAIDAIHVDTSEMSVGEVVTDICVIVKGKFGL